MKFWGRVLFSDCLLWMTIEYYFFFLARGHMWVVPELWHPQCQYLGEVGRGRIHCKNRGPCLHGWRNSSARWEKPGQGWMSADGKAGSKPQSFPSRLPAQYSVIPLPSENVRKDRREAVGGILCCLSARQGTKLQCRIRPVRRVGQFAVRSGT